MKATPYLPEMFEQGWVFMDCAEKYFESQNQCVKVAMSTPVIVNYSFACEVFLKILCLIHNKSLEKKHELKDLFECLPKEVRDTIMERTILRSGCMDFMYYRDKNLNCGNEELRKVSAAFVDWRYSYEYTKCSLHANIGFLQAFCVELRELCCRNIFNIKWVDYKRWWEKNG